MGNFWAEPEAKIRVIKAIKSDLAAIIETQTRSFRGRLERLLQSKAEFWKMKQNLILNLNLVMTCTSDQKTNPYISALDKIYMPLPLGVMCEYPSTEKYGCLGTNWQLPEFPIFVVDIAWAR